MFKEHAVSGVRMVAEGAIFPFLQARYIAFLTRLHERSLILRPGVPVLGMHPGFQCQPLSYGSCHDFPTDR